MTKEEYQFIEAVISEMKKGILASMMRSLL